MLDHTLQARDISLALRRSSSASEKYRVLSKEFDFFWSLPDEADCPSDAGHDWSPQELPQWRSVREAKLLYPLVDIVAAPARRGSSPVTDTERSLRTLVFRILGGVLNLQESSTDEKFITFLVKKLPAIVEGYRTVYQSDPEQVEKSRSLGIRSAIVALVSYVFFSLPPDEKQFFDLVESDTFLWILFDRVFDPLEKFESKSDLGQLICDILHDLLQEGPPFNFVDQRFLSKLIRKFGVPHVCATCLDWISNYPHLGGARLLLLCMLSYRPTQVEFIRHQSIHTKMARVHWRTNPQDSDKSARFSMIADGMNYLEDIVTMLEVVDSHELQVEIIDDLVRKEDLIGLMGRVVLWRYRDTGGRVRYNLDTIATFCLERQDTMETHVKPYWSFVFHRLQVVWYDPKEVLQQTELDRVFINPDGPSDPFPSALALWRWFGSKLKLDELALQKDDIACRHQHSNSLIGCSWARCSLFGEDLTSQLSKPILLCSRCRKAQYCSLQCQKAHWQGGTHKFDCLRPQEGSLV